MQQENHLTSQQLRVFENNTSALSRVSLSQEAAANVLPPLSMVSHLRLGLPRNLASSLDKLSALGGAFGEMKLLEELEIHHAHRWPRSAPIILPNSMRTLRFTVASWHLVGPFLQTLSIIPAEEMTIRCDGSERNEFIGSFNAQFPRLTTLRLISDVACPLIVMSIIARSISSIHHFYIGPVQDIRNSLAMLGQSDAQAGDHSEPNLLWPEMRVLSIDTGIEADILASDLHQLIIKRAALNCPIHTIRLSPARITHVRESRQHDFAGLGVQFAELERAQKSEWW